MSFSAIPTSIRYQSDGETCAWPVPFPFGGQQAVGCMMLDAGGNERELVYGTDYFIKDNCVMAFIPKGSSIAIWLNQSLEEAIGGARDKALQSDTAITSTRQAGIAADSGPAADPGNSEEIAALAAEIKELRALQENALVQARLAEEDRQVRRIAEEGDKAASLVASAAQNSAQSASFAIDERAKASLNELVAVSSDAVSEAESARLKAVEAQNAANEAIKNLNAARAALDDKIAEAQIALANAGEQGLQSLNAFADNAAMTMAAAENDAVTRVRASTDIYQNCINQEGFFTQTADWKSGSIIPLPNGISYYPGRYMLRVTCKGMVLVQGVHYQEIANTVDPGAPSGEIRILFDSEAGSLWSFWVVASNASNSAINAAAEAEDARRQAEQWAARARDYANGIEDVRDDTNRIAIQAQANLEVTGKEYDARLTTIKRDTWNIGQEAAANLDAKAAAHSANLANIQARIELEGAAQSQRLADETAAHSRHLWQIEHKNTVQAENAAKSAANAYEMALSAWQNAWQASMQSTRPGIAAVAKTEDVFNCASGLYIVNPLVKTSPTIFMGVWPVKSIADIQYDGIFFIGPEYPEAPNPPPAPKPLDPSVPPKPQEPASPTADSAMWGPCIHH